MDDFFNPFPIDMALEMEQLARLVFETRQAHRQILTHYDVIDEAALLARIQAGLQAEHPAYEHYLAARILAQTHQTARQALSERTQEANQ